MLTDEQLIETFTPLERKFYEWEQNGGDINTILPGKLKKFLNTFPGHYDIVRPAWNSYVHKWYGRTKRRMDHPVSRDEFHHFVATIEPQYVGFDTGYMQMRNVLDYDLGHSGFGGSLHSYAVSFHSHSLDPRPSSARMVSEEDYDALDEDPDVLDTAVLSIDLTTFQPSTPILRPVSASRDSSQRHRRSSQADGISQASHALHGLNPPHAPLIVFQIGVLIARPTTTDMWLSLQEEPEHERDHNDWEETGYTVVVQLDKTCHPTGPVFVVYNYTQLEDTQDGYVVGDFEDKKGNELPHIRTLYPGCDEKFYLAKIANKLEDLDVGVEIEFQVQSYPKGRILPMRLIDIGPSPQIISDKLV